MAKYYNKLSLVLIICLVLSITGCKNKEEKVSDAIRDGNKKINHEVNEAQKDIGAAQAKVQGVQLEQKAEAIKAEQKAQAIVVEAVRKDTKEINKVQNVVVETKQEAAVEIDKAQREANDAVNQAAN